MKVLIGASRPAFTRKTLLIAAAVIVLFLAWAKAGFPCSPCDYYFMGPDGVLIRGMMPPDGGYGTPPGKGGQPQPKAQAQAAMPANPGNNAKPPLVVVQDGYKYEATENHGVYRITRNGAAWLTLTLNKKTGLYELSDPNGTNMPVLRLGTPKSGPIKLDSGPSSTH